MSVDKKQEIAKCCGSTSTEGLKHDGEENKFTTDDKIKSTIRNQYASIATQNKMMNNEKEEITNCVCTTNENYTTYSKEVLEKLPDGADLGLGSGNPVALSSIVEGEIIVDLGSGAGIDCFIASKITGNEGTVIGVDMTSEMIYKARKNAQDGNFSNVEFRLGEIENLPIADNTADVIVSNCVINLSTDKVKVFKEAYRVLKPGGRMIFSDIVLDRKLPKVVDEAMQKQCSCVSRAIIIEEYLELIKKAGFENVEVVEKQIISPRAKLKEIDGENVQTKLIVDGNVMEIEMSKEEYKELSKSIMTAHIKAIKPQ